MTGPEPRSFEDTLRMELSRVSVRREAFRRGDQRPPPPITSSLKLLCGRSCSARMGEQFGALPAVLIRRTCANRGERDASSVVGSQDKTHPSKSEAPAVAVFMLLSGRWGQGGIISDSGGGK